ncbi:hypothetical protein Q31b_27140 [Novipirellula aureliae]|uniref:PEP-CTERM protein-sorting domain-containing protein n=1 Tax=Novipirellula aureliae TaxID=2527966 RepID=A0A5C6DXY6_9BACT|nr:PEP-CTERM sorting domain-containing protein [Novipirellula aureliae]TWU41275.1 hypothetical protein Q31b_27140 [Novipirellula aureliae]
MRLLVLLALYPTFAAIYPQSATAAPIVVGTVIDSFDDPTPQINSLDYLTASPTRTTYSARTDPSILGLEREMFFEVTQNPGLQASVNVLPILGGVLNVNNGAGVKSTSRVLWDGIGTSSLNTDLTNGGVDNLLAASLISVDQTAELTFRLVDTSSRTATLTRSNLSSGTELFEFADFTQTSGFDFRSIRSVELAVTGPEGVDLNLDFYGTAHVVPEPTALSGLLSLFVWGVAAKRRKRR